MIDLDAPDWAKCQNSIPAIVQHAVTGAVLMLGYMSREALAVTLATHLVTFFSRSKQRLWTKGESSGNTLALHDIAVDCDGDALLVLATPHGPTCHLGTATCWGENPPQASVADVAFLGELENVIAQRIRARPSGSYTARLLDAGIRRIAQKVGEEGLELALAGVVQSDAEIVAEATNLLYHTLLLLKVKDLSLARVVAQLRARHMARG